MQWIESALAEGRCDVRLVTPTATMAEHLRHELARRGFAFRPAIVTTLSGLIESLTPGVRPVPAPLLRLLVEDVLDDGEFPDFHEVIALPGFRDAITALVSELSSSGCDDRRLPHSVGKVMAALRTEVRARGWVLRDEWVAAATAQVHHHGFPGVREIHFDGFYQFSAPELELIRALESCSRVTIAPQGDPRPSAMKPVVIEAPTLTQEVEEIARRILEQAAAGRPFREMAVVVRARAPYVPAIETVFERFGIPARFYFASNLESHDAVRSLASLVDAMPKNVDELPTAWSERLRSLRASIPVESPRDFNPLAVTLLRNRLAALATWEAAIEQTASALPVKTISLAEFWRRARLVIGAAQLRVPDDRRDVVHVMDVYEARQWNLPVVFLLGLVERQFPRYHSPDPILPDSIRRTLGLPTSAEGRQEERLLFDLVCSRATEILCLSYPRFDGKGLETVRSFFLDSSEPATPAIAVRPISRATEPVSHRTAVNDPALLVRLREVHSSLTPTRIETFLQCPFQFFARYTLGLEPMSTPEDRVDYRILGNVVHQVLQSWRPGADLERLVTATFDRQCLAEGLPRGYATEKARLDLIRDLRRLIRELPPPSAIETEKKFRIALDSGVEVRGRIDRYETVGAGQAAIVDYKYSTTVPALTREYERDLRIQAGIYALAALRQFGHSPASVDLIGLREGIEQIGWSGNAVLQLAERAERLASNAAAAIHAGRIEVLPADSSKCRLCDFSDTCRIESQTRITVEAGA